MVKKKMSLYKEVRVSIYVVFVQSKLFFFIILFFFSFSRFDVQVNFYIIQLIFTRKTVLPLPDEDEIQT